MHLASSDLLLKSGYTKSNEALTKLYEKERSDSSFRIAVIGAGAYGRTLASQLSHIPGLRLAALCDIDPEPARQFLSDLGLDAHFCRVVDRVADLEGLGIDLLVDCTGSPAAGAEIAGLACRIPAHLVMVNAEADACIGPEIAARIEAAGKVYSLADGDQPSLTVGLADWATAIGFSVVTAGKWTDAWDPRGANEIEAEWVSQGRVVSDTDRMFLDGSKANIELGSTANCLGFVPDVPGMHGESTGLDRIPSRFRASGPDAVFSSSGIVDYINCVGLSKDQVYPGGVFVVAESANRTGMKAMARKGNIVSDDLRHVLFYRPYHLLGVETVHSIVRVLLYGIPTASPKGRYTEVVAIAKQDLKAGEVLLGAGYELRGELWTVSDSRSAIAVPSGLAAGATVLRDIAAGSPLTLKDVNLDTSDPAVALRGDLSGSTARPGTQHG